MTTHRAVAFNDEKRAFTLIEILVVLAILMILAAILFSAFGRVRESGKAASCASNLRQMGLGLTQYSEDYDGIYPEAGSTIAWDAIDPTTNRGPWTQQIWPYVKSQSLYHCPSDSHSDYSYFLSCRAAYLQYGAFGSIDSKRIAQPTLFVLGGETLGLEGIDADKDDYTQNCVGGPDAGQPAEEWRCHNSAQNILFSDGHIKRFTAFNPGLMTFDYTTMKAWP